MRVETEHIPGVTDDPVLRLILSGRASDLDEAEELYLDETLPAVFALIGSKMSDEELLDQPLIALLRSRGTRGREDSIF